MRTPVAYLHHTHAGHGVCFAALLQGAGAEVYAFSSATDLALTAAAAPPDVVVADGEGPRFPDVHHVAVPPIPTGKKAPAAVRALLEAGVSRGRAGARLMTRTAVTTAHAHRPTAVVIDDDPKWRELVAATLAQGGYASVTASSYSEAIDVLSADPVAAAIVDLGLPAPSGLVLIDRLSAVFPETAVVVLTGDSERATAAEARRRGADGYLIKPVQPAQLILALDVAIEQRRLRLSESAERADEEIDRLVRVAQARDAETGRHSARTADVAAALAAELGLEPSAAERIRGATLLHDIGKVGVPDEILHKPGLLTEGERTEVQCHDRIGWQILSGSPDPVMEVAASIALAHHERWDGSGYPLGLAGMEIPIEARIVAVADVFTAVTCDRPYRKAMTLDEACAVIREGSGSHFDHAVVAAFIASDSVRLLTAAAPDHTPGVPAVRPGRDRDGSGVRTRARLHGLPGAGETSASAALGLPLRSVDDRPTSA